MKKVFNLLLMSCLLATSMCFTTGCQKDNNGNSGNNPGGTVPDPEETITVSMRHGTDVTPNGCSTYFMIGSDDNFIGNNYYEQVWVDNSHYEEGWIDGYYNYLGEWIEGHYEMIWVDDGYYITITASWEFTTIGQMSGLGNITTIPTSGWASKVAVIPGYGYVARCNATHVRIYVEEYILAAGTNGVIGAVVKYQSPFNP
jgi:hypothetical protein